MISILILTIAKRKQFLDRLLVNLFKQIGGDEKEIICIHNLTRYIISDFEILIHKNETANIGKKRNDLLQAATGDYVCFFDDDDTPTEHYIPTLREGIKSNPDCISLRGIMTTNGKNPEIFEHSIKHKEYATNPDAALNSPSWVEMMGGKIKYIRYPNHLNLIRSSIAKQFKFREINHGEDTDWATQIFNSGLLKTEYYHSNIIYNYLYRTKK